MTSQGSAHGRFQRAIQRRNLFQAELAIRAMGSLNPVDPKNSSACFLRPGLIETGGNVGSR